MPIDDAKKALAFHVSRSHTFISLSAARSDFRRITAGATYRPKDSADGFQRRRCAKKARLYSYYYARVIAKQGRFTLDAIIIDALTLAPPATLALPAS